MAISPISGSASGIAPIAFPDLNSGGGDNKATEAAGGFGDKLTGALENLQKTESKSEDLAMKVATGELTDIHDYMIAANQAQIATQLTVAVRNKAVESFNQIMNMQV
jgi:flagellar hook-basal body complex protein FliE